MAKIKAAIFDLDGTIVFSHPTHFKAYQRLFEPFGISWNFAEFNDVFAGTGAPTIIKMMLTRHGVKDYNLQELVYKKRDIFNELLAEEKLQTVPGFFKFLNLINGRGFKRIIASGSNRANILHMLKNIGAQEQFPRVVSGEDVALPKPAPDIFLKACETIGCAPTECVVLEDTSHGVLGAKAANMQCIAFTTTADARALKKAGADLILPDYNSIDEKVLETL